MALSPAGGGMLPRSYGRTPPSLAAQWQHAKVAATVTTPLSATTTHRKSVDPFTSRSHRLIQPPNRTSNMSKRLSRFCTSQFLQNLVTLTCKQSPWWQLQYVYTSVAYMAVNYATQTPQLP